MTNSVEYKFTKDLYDAKASFVTNLECSITGKDDYKAGEIHGLSEAGRPLLVRYDLDAIKNSVTKEEIEARPGGFWKYRELLPVNTGDAVTSLGEVMTPLIPLKASVPDGYDIIVKDEGRLPTGSFKARGLGMAVAMAKELGQTHLAMPTNGNAGAALAAYASYAGLKTTVFCPDDTPIVNIREIELQGADVYTVNGLINDCGKIVFEGKEEMGWADISTLKEPYRIEGKKTMGLELAEQLGWEMPDVIFYPTGGGTGLIGMWKAFDEMEKLGWIGSKRPKMVAVQAEGCAPIVKAYDDGEEHAPLWDDAFTEAWGIRVPVAVGDFLILRAVRESGGFAIAVKEDHIFDCRDRVAKQDGVLLCPEGAATFAAWEMALESGQVSKDDKVILFNCATGLKYPMPETDQFLDKNEPIDYGQFK
ncbi:threonine synthase [Pseudemcibacter aquimaris]|uniref:threonine synthase n=1 Tax=Pseudemcibacter aquimaris TaxID=2857064 RepID=UPI002011DDD6|nr:threonine synthase [Pseudemcibacter aquimaris]MCC3861340.1 threonine synthase [Pseudemcibacter aquimaris]WDU58112.1 threonine synthase [Pseudemcibacter aquimaris]